VASSWDLILFVMHKTQISKLETEAKAAALNAYAPYSKFRVGASVATASGKIFTGCNIENASFGLTICAERVALSAAVLAGERKIIAICVACIDAPPATAIENRSPCGACRQWIQELAPEAKIIIAGVSKAFKIKDFLPRAFKLS
jgi:cytidine deaminase